MVESFWFFSHQNIEIGEQLLLLSLFVYYHVWSTLFTIIGPNVWLSLHNLDKSFENNLRCVFKHLTLTNIFYETPPKNGSVPCKTSVQLILSPCDLNNFKRSQMTPNDFSWFMKHIWSQLESFEIVLSNLNHEAT